VKVYLAPLCAAVLLLGSLTVSVSAAADGPSLSVVPSTGLAGGDTVHVTAAGITPSSTVAVIQCDLFNGDPTRDCDPRATTGADALGQVSVDVSLDDPVWRNQEVGDARPVYCRADVCHLFLSWTDATGLPQVLSSDALEFSGSPATVAARPSSNLTASRQVKVTGTAFGAEGRVVRILQKTCFNGASAGSGCAGDQQLPVVTTTVRADGTFSAHYRVRRLPGDGSDCADPGPISWCEINAIVLDAGGAPDDSFGVSDIGQPAAFLTFRTP
jgi:hypothetical protein